VSDRADRTPLRGPPPPHAALATGAIQLILPCSGSSSSMRGEVHELGGGTKLIATIHPSFLLRLPDRARAAEERAAFVADLARVRKLVA